MCLFLILLFKVVYESSFYPLYICQILKIVQGRTLRCVTMSFWMSSVQHAYCDQWSASNYISVARSSHNMDKIRKYIEILIIHVYIILRFFFYVKFCWVIAWFPTVNATLSNSQISAVINTWQMYPTKQFNLKNKMDSLLISLTKKIKV